MNYLKDLKAIDKEQRKKLVDALRVGTPENVACSFAGIKPIYLKHLIWLSKEVIKINDCLIKQGYKTVKELTKDDLISFQLNRDIALEMLKNYQYGKVAVEFYNELQQAKSECVVYHLTQLRHAKGNWNSSAWYLERVLPEYFAKKDNYQNKEDNKVEQIQVVYVNSKNDEKERIEKLEKEVKDAIGVKD